MKKRQFIYVSSFILFLLLSCQTQKKTTLLPKTKQYLQYEKKFKTILTHLPKDSADIPYGIPINKGLITICFGQTNNIFTGEKIFLDRIAINQYLPPVVVTANGIVSKKYWKNKLTIRIKHKYNFETEYIGLYKVFVKVGQYIKKGTKIGLGGAIHMYCGPNTFYRIFHNKIAINPVLLNKKIKLNSVLN